MVTPARDREAFDQAVARGSEALKQGKLDDATRAFYAALEADPGNTKGLALLGLTLFRSNHFAEARPIYEDLVERAPTDASHRLNLGLVYLKLGDGDKAINALEASRALDPAQGRAISYLGLAYARAGRYAEAYRSFLLAGQNELATEIEVNLTPAERDGINSQLGRPPGPSSHAGEEVAIPRTVTPASQPAPSAEVPRGTVTPHAVPRSQIEEPPPVLSRTKSEPRTRPPSAPPKREGTPQLSSPEITIIRPDADRVPSVTSATPRPDGLGDIRSMTESQQFVLPARDPNAPPEALDEKSMVSRAVALAGPSVSAVARTISGGLPPRPLSDLATEDLVRPDDGDETFEIGPHGSLTIRIGERVLTRLEGVYVTGGDLRYEPAMRRSRGHQTDERFEYDGSGLHVVSGKGYLIAVPTSKQTFAAIRLDDDILYLREDLVFAFESTLRWENGNVPGLRGKLFVVQFRGDGALALRTARPLVRVKLPPQGLVFVDADRIAGWIGRVIPRAVVPPSGGPLGARCIECTGEGIVLVEPAGDDVVPKPVLPVAVARVDEPPAPPPKPEVIPELAGLGDEPEPPDESNVPGRDEI